MLWGQFTWADVPGPGPFAVEPGWKVTAVTAEAGPLDPSVVERAAAALAEFTPAELPLLATPAELDALPRRLRLESIGTGTTVLTQQVSCGYAGDHQPSWFAHGLVFSRAPGIAGVRPGELWDSPDWLRPVDSAEVAAARPAPGFGAAATPVTGRWKAAAELVPLMLSLLENAAGSGGPMSRIAIVDATGAEAAQWVRFLGRFLSTGAAWSVPFSTVEQTASSVDRLRIVGVPKPLPLGADWVVVDPARPPSFVPGPVAGWRLSDGRWLPRGPWATFAAELAADLGVERLQDLIDEQTEWAGTSADHRPLWALPVAVLLAESSLFSTRSPQRRAAAILAASWWPEQLVTDPGRRATLAAALTRSHPEPMLVATMLLRGADRDERQEAGEADALLEVYVDGLLGPDGRSWMIGTGPLPWLPVNVRPSSSLRARWSERLPGRIGGMPNPRDAVEVTRLLTVVVNLAERWSALDHPTLSAQVAPRLAAAMAETLLNGFPVVEGRWPLLPRPVADLIAEVLVRALDVPASRDPVVAALHWMDAQFGPVDLDAAGQNFQFATALDVARTAALAIGGRSDRDVATIRTAQAIRRANRVPGLR